MVVSDATADAILAARAGGRSTWRVSSTLFVHVASDAMLQPLGPFATQATTSAYPAMQAGEQVGRGGWGARAGVVMAYRGGGHWNMEGQEHMLSMGREGPRSCTCRKTKGFFFFLSPVQPCSLVRWKALP